jgi:CRP-like cAMP-binding protein
MEPLFIDFDMLAASAFETRRFKAGDVIFNEGDKGSEFFVIRSGRTSVRRGDRILEELGPGEVFGEMALIDNEPRSATVVAETDCVVVPVGERQFLFMTSQAPYFTLSLMRILVRRLRAASKATA